MRRRPPAGSARAAAAGCRVDADHAGRPQEQRARQQPVGDVEIVRGEDDRCSRLAAARCSRADQRRRRRLVEAGERLVEQDQPRIVQQRALEREALPHAAREAADTRSSARSARPARSSADVDRAGNVGERRTSCAKNARFSRAVSSG